jgi:hypothetical protein
MRGRFVAVKLAGAAKMWNDRRKGGRLSRAPDHEALKEGRA